MLGEVLVNYLSCIVHTWFLKYSLGMYQATFSLYFYFT
jgi:hypothetical protein